MLPSSVLMEMNIIIIMNMKLLESLKHHAHCSLTIYRVFFLIVVFFDSASCLYFSPDFIHRPLIFFARFCAIEWGIGHNSKIFKSREISQYVKSVWKLFHVIWNISLSFESVWRVTDYHNLCNSNLVII